MVRKRARSVCQPPTVMFATLIGLAWVLAASAQTGALRADPDRVPIEGDIRGHPISVPTVLLVQLKKDLGDNEYLPKTVDLLARRLKIEKLSLVDPRSAMSPRSFPKDAEFYWLSGPAPAFCGSGGCSSQLYWASPSAATSGRLYPTTEPEVRSAFNRSPSVLPRSTNGLFDLSLSEASDSHPGSRRPILLLDATLTFDGQRYVIQIKKP
jgi:hypothetical protein